LTGNAPQGHPTHKLTRVHVCINEQVEGYKKLLDYYMDNKYTLRYCGGLVPDVYQQFTKTMGVFTNPTSDKSPAKLRLAFEASPWCVREPAAPPAAPPPPHPLESPLALGR